MTATRIPRSDRTDSININDLQLDVAVIKNDISGIKLVQQTILTKMDTFDFVKVADLKDFKNDVENNYVQKTDYSNLVWMVRALVTGLVSLIVYIVQVRR